MIHKYRQIYNQLMESEEKFNYSTIDEIKQDKILLQDYISDNIRIRYINECMYMKPQSLKLIITENKIRVTFFNTFLRNSDDLEQFYKVKDFNEWINTL